jgi:hypothetical protein
MNNKRISGEEVDKQYAFFYISLTKERFYEFSELVCKKNNISSNELTVRVSAVKECCNRIGARLLKFINQNGYAFDIGTPVLLPGSAKILNGEDIKNIKNTQLWPFNFYKTEIVIDDIPIHFASTILESPEQRYEVLINNIIDITKKQSEVVVEKEFMASSSPNVFNLHYLLTLLTDEQIIISFSKRYLLGTIILFGIDNNPNQSQKDSIMEFIRNNMNVRSIEIYEDIYPDVPSDCLIKIIKATRGKNNIHMAVTAVI